MKEELGVKQQYSRMSIFRRIYQYCTTHEQTAFTINHHHTTTSDNSRLPENMPRTCIQVLFDKRTQQEARGLHSKSALFHSKKRTSLRRLPQDNSFSNAIRFKTLQLFVPNSKRLGGYTHWVHFFLQKSAHHSEDFFKIDHFKATRQKEPGHSYIRALFDKEPGYMLRSPSTKNQSDFKRRPSSSLCQTAWGSGATPKWGYFFL